MAETPFILVWPVDQTGYEIVRRRVDPETAELLGEEGHEVVVPRGGLFRFYRPLDNDGLWLRFAQSCKDADSVLAFANEFGRFGNSAEGLDPDDRVDQILKTATLIRGIAERLEARERLAAAQLLNRNLPMMRAGILWFADQPERFHYRFFPVTLRDALLYQAGEAITGNRQFRRCRNGACPNWFRLGQHAAAEGRGHTITTRREFCSDRCRVAHARQQKREVAAHA
jgi:hypothetical protein